MRRFVDDSREPSLFEELRRALRSRHCSPRTERAYVGWAKRFIAFHDQRHPRELGASEIREFLDDLLRRRASKSSHQQALCALQFLYQHGVCVEWPRIDGLQRPRHEHHLPTVLTRDEVRSVLSRMSGTPKLMASLLYGSGLRLLECARLRIKDVDIDAGRILIRDGKGNKDRLTMLPARLREPLRLHLRAVRRLFDADVASGAGYVELPGALALKYPKAAREWPWQWVFPATRQYREARTDQLRRHHLHETVLQKSLPRRMSRRKPLETRHLPQPPPL